MAIVLIAIISSDPADQGLMAIPAIVGQVSGEQQAQHAGLSFTTATAGCS
jgi:hypothetical protein